MYEKFLEFTNKSTLFADHSPAKKRMLAGLLDNSFAFIEIEADNALVKQWLSGEDGDFPSQNFNKFVHKEETIFSAFRKAALQFVMDSGERIEPSILLQELKAHKLLSSAKFAISMRKLFDAPHENAMRIDSSVGDIYIDREGYVVSLDRQWREEASIPLRFDIAEHDAFWNEHDDSLNGADILDLAYAAADGSLVPADNCWRFEAAMPDNEMSLLYDRMIMLQEALGISMPGEIDVTIDQECYLINSSRKAAFCQTGEDGMLDAPDILGRDFLVIFPCGKIGNGVWYIIKAKGSDIEIKLKHELDEGRTTIPLAYTNSYVFKDRTKFEKLAKDVAYLAQKALKRKPGSLIDGKNIEPIDARTIETAPTISPSA